MQQRLSMHIACFTLILLTTCLPRADAYTIVTNPPRDQSLLLRSFAGSNDLSTARIRIQHGATGKGWASYVYTNNTPIEGYLHFGLPTNNLTPSLFTHLRTRVFRYKSGGANNLQCFPYPVFPGNFATVNLGGASNFVERVFDISGLSVNGTGVRFDPFNYTNDGSNDVFGIDYIYAEAGRTVGFEFDRDDDGLGLTYNTNKWAAGPVFTNGFLTGQAMPGGGAASDVQISFDPFFANLNFNLRKYVEVRAQGFPGDRIDFFWRTGTNTLQRIELDSASDGTMNTYLLDMNGETNWSGTPNFLRLDPAVSSNATFAVDYIRFYETLVPEPFVREPGTVIFIK